MHVVDSPAYRLDVRRVAELPLPWDDLDGTTVVISGASGMIGSCLVDVLMARTTTYGNNYTVYALARHRQELADRFRPYAKDPRLVVMPVDVSAGPVDVGQADYVIHAAGNTHPVAYSTDPIGTIMTNVSGTQAMLDLARRRQARRTVFLSTVEIYGENRGTGKFCEGDLGYIDCNTLRAGYPESKRVGEALCQAFRTQYGLDVVIPRLPRVYGPTLRPTDSKALSQFLFKAVAGQDIVLKSDGAQVYSYCHVADAVSAILVCLLSGRPGQAYNVAAPSSDIRLRDLAQLVADTAGCKVVHDRPDAVEQRGYSAATLAVMDGTRLSELGWAPLYDIREGVRRTIGVLTDIME